MANNNGNSKSTLKTAKGGVGMARSGVIRAVSPSKLPSPDDFSDRDSFDSNYSGGGGGGGNSAASPNKPTTPAKSSSAVKPGFGSPVLSAKGSPLKSAAVSALKPAGAPSKVASALSSAASSPVVVGVGEGGGGVVKKLFKAKEIQVFYDDGEEDEDEGIGQGGGGGGGGGGECSDNSEAGDEYFM